MSSSSKKQNRSSGFSRYLIIFVVLVVGFIALCNIGSNTKSNVSQTRLKDQPEAANIEAANATPTPTQAVYIIAATQSSLVVAQTADAMELSATEAAINLDIKSQQLELQRKQTDFIQSQQPNFWSSFFPVVMILLVLVGLLSFGMALIYRWKHLQFEATELEARNNTLSPDSNGNYQIRITRYGVISPAPGNVIQPVPTTLHYNYAPHRVTNRKGFTRPDTMQTLEAAPTKIIAGELVDTIDLPTKLDLLDYLKQTRPNPENLEIVFGFTANGPIIRPFGEETLHFGDVGATGSGKSSACQSDMFQLALADPSARRVTFGFFDLEGKTSKPFAQALHTAFIADEPEKAAEWLIQLEEMMNQRAKMNPEDLAKEMMWAIMLEEFLDLRDELDKDSWTRIIRIARKGRKCNMFLLCANQTFYSDEDTRIIKGQLRTRSLFTVEDRGAGNAFGFRDNQMIDQLNKWAIKGRFVTKDNGQFVYAQKPYIAPERIETHFLEQNAAKAAATSAHFSPLPSHFQTVNEPLPNQSIVEVVQDPRLEVVRDLLRQRKTTSDILEQVWNVKGGGNAYKKAAEELRDLVAQLV